MAPVTPPNPMSGSPTSSEGGESLPPKSDGQSEQLESLADTREDTALDQNDRSAKGSEWWGELHPPPAPGDPDHKYIFVDPGTEITRDDARQVVQGWKATLGGDGTTDPSPMGDHLRQSTPPLERFEKMKDRLRQNGLEITDQMEKTIFEQLTQNIGFMASLQEFAAGKKELPVELANELVRQIDRMKMEMATQVNLQSQRIKVLEDDLQECERKRETEVEKLEADKKYLEADIEEFEEKIREVEEEAKEKEASDQAHIVRLNKKVAQLQKEKFALENATHDTEDKAESKQDEILNQLSRDELAAVEEKVKRLENERQELRSAFQNSYYEILQVKSSWALVIKHIASDLKLIKQVPLKVRKVMRVFYKDLLELERKVLLCWPETGATMKSGRVERIILAKRALDKAEESLEQQLARIVMLTREVQDFQDRKEKGMQSLMGVDVDAVNSNSEDQWEDEPKSEESSEFIWDVDERNLNEMDFVAQFTDNDETDEPEDETDEPGDSEESTPTTSEAQGTRNKGKGIATTSEVGEESSKDPETLKVRPRKKPSKLQIVRNELASANSQIEKLTIYLDEAQEKIAAQEEALAAPAPNSQEYLTVAHFQPQLTSIDDVINIFYETPGRNDGRRSRRREETGEFQPNSADRFNYFNFQYMLNLRSMILKALQHDSKEKTRELLDSFSDWHNAFAKELSGMDVNVRREIDGSRQVLEAYWHYFHNNDPAKAAHAIRIGYREILAVDPNPRLEIYLRLGQRLHRVLKLQPAEVLEQPVGGAPSQPRPVD